MHARVTRYVRACVRATHEYTRVHTGQKGTTATAENAMEIKF